MDKGVCLYALFGLLAGSIFSSCICETPRNFEAGSDCNYVLGSIEKSLSTISKTIYHGLLILAIKFMHCLISRSYKGAASYTMIMPFWVAFTLSVSYKSGLSLS